MSDSRSSFHLGELRSWLGGRANSCQSGTLRGRHGESIGFAIFDKDVIRTAAARAASLDGLEPTMITDDAIQRAIDFQMALLADGVVSGAYLHGVRPSAEAPQTLTDGALAGKAGLTEAVGWQEDSERIRAARATRNVAFVGLSSVKLLTDLEIPVEQVSCLKGLKLPGWAFKPNGSPLSVGELLSGGIALGDRSIVRRVTDALLADRTQSGRKMLDWEHTLALIEATRKHLSGLHGELASVRRRLPDVSVKADRQRIWRAHMKTDVGRRIINAGLWKPWQSRKRLPTLDDMACELVAVETTQKPTTLRQMLKPSARQKS